jgi:hypothetical protein
LKPNREDPHEEEPHEENTSKALKTGRLPHKELLVRVKTYLQQLSVILR